MTNQHFIFISYRRSDSISETGRIYDSLSAHFGKECVFKDVFDIPYGVDFAEHLEQAVSQCQVLIVVIGNRWLSVTDAKGNRRLDAPEDFVRLEIASALQRDILVVPLLVNGAMMPPSSQLPENLKPLARRNAAQVRHDPDYHDDMNRVIALIQAHFQMIGESTTLTEPPAVTSSVAPSAQKQIAPNSIVVLAILSGVNGSLSLLDPLIFSDYFDVTGMALSVSICIVSWGAAFGLFHLKSWGWSVALWGQIIVLVVSMGLLMLYDNPGLILMIPIIAILILISLFRPRVRRFFESSEPH